MSFFQFDNNSIQFQPLFKVSTNGKKINKWTIEVLNNKYRTISGYNDGKQTISEWTICFPKNTGKRNATTAEQQAFIEAEALYKKRQEKGYTPNIEHAHNKKYFEPMLANDYKKVKNKLIYPVYSQPKLDGIRCIITSEGMWSRNGKQIVSCPHIFKSLKFLFRSNPSLILDGELYADKFATDFDSLTSIVKKTKPSFEDLKLAEEQMEYWIYDVPSINDVFYERYLDLCDLPIDTKYIKIVDTHIADNEQDIDELYKRYINEGFEGQMIRTNSLYENKRTNSLLKNKEFITEEYIIKGISEGKGNRSGMVGKMHFTNEDGILFDSNVKASWDRLKEMWLEKDELIGKIATIKYFNLTPNGIPRFPYVIAIRDYE